MVEKTCGDKDQEMKTAKIQGVLRKNLGLKLLALAFTLFLWFFVVGEEEAEVSLNVPLELVNMPKDTIITDQFNGMIDVRVYGPRSLIRELAARRLGHVVDLANARPGKMILHITPESIQLPRRVRVTRIHPSQVTLTLEPLVRREVPIEMVIKGAVAADHELKGVRLSMPSVTLAGSSREIAKVKKVLTQPIDISGLGGSTEIVAGLDLQAPYLTVVGEPRIVAQIQVEEKRVQEELVIPVEGLGAVSAYTIAPNRIKVSLSGPIGEVRSAARDKNIRALVELRGLRPGVYMKRPVIQAPSGVEIEKTRPRSVKVTVVNK